MKMKEMASPSTTTTALPTTASSSAASSEFGTTVRRQRPASITAISPPSSVGEKKRRNYDAGAGEGGGGGPAEEGAGVMRPSSSSRRARSARAAASTARPRSSSSSALLLALCFWSVALLTSPALRRANGRPSSSASAAPRFLLSEALAIPLIPRSSSRGRYPPSYPSSSSAAHSRLGPNVFTPPGGGGSSSSSSLAFSLGKLRGGGADSSEKRAASSIRGGSSAAAAATPPKTQCNVLKSHGVGDASTSSSGSLDEGEEQKKNNGQEEKKILKTTAGGSSSLIDSLASSSDLDETTDDYYSDDAILDAGRHHRGSFPPLEALSSSDEDHNRIIPCEYVAETQLPTDVGQFRLRAYRVSDSAFATRNRGANRYVGTEPCVIYAADKPPFGVTTGGVAGRDGVVRGRRGVPVRIHDQCFTSEVFRSQRCDCKEQLKMSLEYIKEHGGAIVYLQQEGRGIGLANKVAAYALQDVGMDTVDANIHLGFPEDNRQYGVVPSILSEMGIDSINLITNNPRKLERLRDLGVDIDGTIPMVVKAANPYNRKYLETKRERMNHANFGSLLLSDPASVLGGGGGGGGGNSTTSTSPPRQVHPNGAMSAKRVAVAEKYINEGEEMAAAAIASALRDDDDDDNKLAGVTASSVDGYCFGRDSVEEAIAAVGRGELVVVVDDMDRENEGDFIMAADLCTPETMATIVRYSSGVICVGMEGRRMDELSLPAMVTNNEDPKGTAFSVTVDAGKQHGITTGISAADRAKTMRLLGSSETTADDFVRPGHIFPLRAKEGGVLERDGHTEAAVDLCRLAGRHPSGVLCEIVSEEDPVNMARLPELKRFCRKHGYVLTSIVDIAQYRRDTAEDK